LTAGLGKKKAGSGNCLPEAALLEQIDALETFQNVALNDET
jgi:hypothetical protein